MSRKRLTRRRIKEAVDGNIPYPGNVNQEGRKFQPADKYDNWVEKINHPLQDLQTLWREDERDDIGFGIPEPWGSSPTVASVRVAANKSVQAAYFLLGNKVAESIVEDQAADFMLLGPEALDRTLARFAETVGLYKEANETEEEADDAAEGKEASEVETLKAKLAEVEAKLAEDDSEDDKEDDKEDAKDDAKEAAEIAGLKVKLAEAELKLAESNKKAADDETEAEADDAAEGKEAAEDDKDDKEDKKDDAKEASEGASKVAELEAQLAEAKAALVAADDDSDSDDSDDAKEASLDATPNTPVNDMDIQLSPVIADEDVNLNEDPRLAGLFDDNIPAELPEPGAGQREASEKVGIKSIGAGQVKVAAASNDSQDISGLWKDSPDVSDVFN